ncbi:MAG: hypothetical protein V3R73_00030, partial [Sphingomonadales bacterium]
VLFIALRAANVYGDPVPWTAQSSGVFTLLSFLNCDKYPPSLLYTLMTLGPAIIALAVFDREPGWLGRRLITFGRVPLFFYLVHIYFIHMAVLVVGVAGGFSVKDFLGGYWHMPRGQGFGFDLGWVYLIWLLVIAALYPVCRWYAALKHTSKHPFFSYL